VPIDKTGTLTLMEMMVVSAVTAESASQVTGQGYAAEGRVLKDVQPAADDPVLMLMGHVSRLCNDPEKLIIRMVYRSRGVPVLADPGALVLRRHKAPALERCPIVVRVPHQALGEFHLLPRQLLVGD
jgi:hypothetical protein